MAFGACGRGFISLAGYYYKFIRDYSTVAAPLTTLLKKDGFLWSAKVTATLDALKTAMTMASVLALPVFTHPFVVKCDVSTHGFGAILLQDKQPIAFFS